MKDTKRLATGQNCPSESFPHAPGYGWKSLPRNKESIHDKSMASYRGHAAGGTIAFGIYLTGLYGLYAVDESYANFALADLVIYVLALFGVCVLFAVWPDVDTNSKAQTQFYTIFLVVDAALILARHFEEAAYFGLLAILPVLSRHRGWTHSWWAALLLPLPLLLLPLLFFPDRPLVGLPFYGAAVCGYASHLVLDRLPLRRRRRR